MSPGIPCHLHMLLPEVTTICLLFYPPLLKSRFFRFQHGPGNCAALARWLGRPLYTRALMSSGSGEGTGAGPGPGEAAGVDWRAPVRAGSQGRGGMGEPKAWGRVQERAQGRWSSWAGAPSHGPLQLHLLALEFILATMQAHKAKTGPAAPQY